MPPWPTALVQGFLHALGTAATHVGQAGAGGQGWLCCRPGWEGLAGSRGDKPARVRLPSFGGMVVVPGVTAPPLTPVEARSCLPITAGEVPGDLCFLSLRASPSQGHLPSPRRCPHEAQPAPSFLIPSTSTLDSSQKAPALPGEDAGPGRRSPSPWQVPPRGRCLVFENPGPLMAKLSLPWTLSLVFRPQAPPSPGDTPPTSPAAP